MNEVIYEVEETKSSMKQMQMYSEMLKAKSESKSKDSAEER